MIFDTNILVYLSKYQLPLQKVNIDQAKISIVSKIEALGFLFDDVQEYNLILALCEEIPVVHLDDAIAEETINLRRHYRVKLPDAIIYATALIENVPLLTNDFADFKNLGGSVQLIHPSDL